MRRELTVVNHMVSDEKCNSVVASNCNMIFGGHLLSWSSRTTHSNTKEYKPEVMYVYVLMSIIIIINCSKKCTLNSYQKHTFVCPFFLPI